MKKYLKVLFILTTVALLSGTVFCFCTLMSVTQSEDYVKLNKNKLHNLNNTLKILDKNGEKIDELYYVNGYKQISLESLPSYLSEAFVSIEDKRFFSHNGVDLKRILGATLKNFKSGSLKEGASTITQQLIKNTHLNNEKTLQRKLNEIILALNVEQSYSKQEILEMYLNTIYFGGNAYGIETASNYYFAKSAKDLNLSESATLAGLIKAPNNYSPLVNYEKSIQRRNVVLKAMLEQNKISFEEYTQAKNEVLSINNAKIKNTYDYVYCVINEACSILNVTPIQLINSDYQIQTFYNASTQKTLENAIEKSSYDSSGMIIDNETYGIKAFFSKTAQLLPNKKRQPGSALKPFAVYGPALEEKQITLATPVLDEHTDFNGYAPKNYANRYHGWTTIKNALTKSLNVPSVKVLNALTVPIAEKYLNKMGLNCQNENLSLALGNCSNGISDIELAGCYATLANDGIYSKLSFVDKITKNNLEIYSKSDNKTKVFSKETSYLLKNALCETSKKGTAKQLSGLNFDVCAKTGTVGTINGNSDAYLCGLTSDESFLFHCVDTECKNNDLTGGNQSAFIAKNYLENAYEKNPENFVIPESVLKLSIDKVMLENEQLIQIANENVVEKTDYYFAKNNLPKEVSKRNLSAIIPLNLSFENGKIKITTESELQNLKIRKIETDEIFELINGEFFDSNVIVGEVNTYRAEVIKNGIIYEIGNNYSISIPNLNELKNDLFDNWFFRFLH